jgi:hypothetical protein
MDRPVAVEPDPDPVRRGRRDGPDGLIRSVMGIGVRPYPGTATAADHGGPDQAVRPIAAAAAARPHRTSSSASRADFASA